MEQSLKAGIWLFTIIAIVLFWLSIRSTTDQMAFSIGALVAWGIAMLCNRFYKKEKQSNE